MRALLGLVGDCERAVFLECDDHSCRSGQGLAWGRYLEMNELRIKFVQIVHLLYTAEITNEQLKKSSKSFFLWHMRRISLPDRYLRFSYYSENFFELEFNCSGTQ